VIELIAGVQAHSLALFSDAGHNFTDALALLLAMFGFYIQGRPANESKTFGYHRAGVLAAFVNALVLLALSAYLLYESWERLLAPQPVAETTMIWGLHRDKEHDLNIRAAFIHMLGDALGSIAIIGGAIAIRYTGWLAIDPILSIAIALLIIWSALDVTRESLNILLEGLPRGMELGHVVEAMRGVDGVIDVHDLHIWSLGSSTHALSSHVVIEDVPPSESDSILRRINELLGNKFHIHHTTIQFENTRCMLSETGCSIPVSAHGHRH
jgi:cobalt-zinc-cadmium efflux system protein